MMLVRKHTTLDWLIFEVAIQILRLRTIWPHDPSNFCDMDRDLDLLFDGSSRIGGSEALDRAAALFGCARHCKLADLMRWAEIQGLVERDGSGPNVRWRRERADVAFIPWLTRSVDVRAAPQGIPVEMLLWHEITKRKHHRRKFGTRSLP